MAVEQALKRDMPNSSIQNVLKKCSAQTDNLKKYLLEIRHGFKVFMVVALYTDNIIFSKSTISTLLKKSGSAYADTVHMFTDKGIVEVFGNDTLKTKTTEELEEIATEVSIPIFGREIQLPFLRRSFPTLPACH